MAPAQHPANKVPLQRIAKDLTCQAAIPCLERSRETSSRVSVNEVSRLRSRHEGLRCGGQLHCHPL